MDKKPYFTWFIGNFDIFC